MMVDLMENYDLLAQTGVPDGWGLTRVNWQPTGEVLRGLEMKGRLLLEGRAPLHEGQRLRRQADGTEWVITACTELCRLPAGDSLGLSQVTVERVMPC